MNPLSPQIPIVNYAKDVQQQIAEFDNTVVRCGLIGASGSGKSSLINAIVGEKVAAVGAIETTRDEQIIRHLGIEFVDLPGCGTTSWPQATYIQDLHLVDYDCFLLITSERFRESDHYLYQELTRLGRPCFLVRNKIDLAIEDEHRENDRSPEDTSRLVRNDIRERLGLDNQHSIYLTSALYPARYDLPQLLSDVQNSLRDVKRERLIADMAAYTEDAFKKKRDIAEKRVRLYAGLAAANGLNPVIGVDVLADIALLVKMGNEVADIYGLSEKRFKYMKRLLNPGSAAKLGVAVAAFASKYLAREGIKLLLKSVAKRVAGKELAKFIPFAGPLVAAGIGWKATFSLGDQLIDEAETLGRTILAEIQRHALEQ